MYRPDCMCMYVCMCIHVVYVYISSPMKTTPEQQVLNPASNWIEVSAACDM